MDLCDKAFLKLKRLLGRYPKLSIIKRIRIRSSGDLAFVKKDLNRPN
jgi:hypothetical protein